MDEPEPSRQSVFSGYTLIGGDTVLRLPNPIFSRAGCIDLLVVVLLRRIIYASAPGMDQESGVASAGSFIPLNEHEQIYYSGLHSVCQADTSGKLSSSKVAELFKASQLPPESLHKVSVASISHICACLVITCFQV